jgi:chemotaxis protein histidine kinase CheA
VVQVLTSHGASVNLKRAVDGETPLFLASYLGYLEIVKHLIGKGADQNIPSDTKETSADAALVDGQSEVLQYLLLHGADLWKCLPKNQKKLTELLEKAKWTKKDKPFAPLSPRHGKSASVTIDPSSNPDDISNLIKAAERENKKNMKEKSKSPKSPRANETPKSPRSNETPKSPRSKEAPKSPRSNEKSPKSPRSNEKADKPKSPRSELKDQSPRRKGDVDHQMVVKEADDKGIEEATKHVLKLVAETDNNPEKYHSDSSNSGEGSHEKRKREFQDMLQTPKMGEYKFRALQEKEPTSPRPKSPRQPGGVVTSKANLPMKCPKCTVVNPPHTVKCSMCGFAFPPPPSSPREGGHAPPPLGGGSSPSSRSPRLGSNEILGGDKIDNADEFFTDSAGKRTKEHAPKLPSDGTFTAMKVDMTILDNDDFWKT